MFCIHYHLGCVYLALERTSEAKCQFKAQTAMRLNVDEARRARIALEGLQPSRR
jgi:hypothetical protein